MFSLLKDIGKAFILVLFGLVAFSWYILFYEGAPMPKDEVLIDLFTSNHDDFEEIKRLSLELGIGGGYRVGTGASSSGRYGGFHDFEVPENLDSLLYKLNVRELYLSKRCVKLQFYNRTNFSIYDWKSLHYCPVLWAEAEIVDTTDVEDRYKEGHRAMYRPIAQNWYVVRSITPND